jgi:peptidoglycan hydrolase-like protein with peptidoglycan-binding domain
MINRTFTIAFSLLTASGFSGPAIARPTLPTTVSVLIAQTEETPQSQPSEGVENLQNRLSQLGYYEGSVNGLYNEELRNALMSFQQDNGLVGTGILDPITRQLLTNPEALPSPPATDSEIVDSALTPSTPDSDTPDSDTPDRVGEPSGLVQPNSTPATAPPTLPEAESPNRLIEADGLGSTTDPDPNSSGDLGPDQETAPTSVDAPPNGIDDAPTEAIPDAEMPETQSGFRFLLLGLAVVALGGLGTGLWLWWARQTGNKQSTVDTVTDSQGIAPMAQPTDAPAVKANVSAPQNGTHTVGASPAVGTPTPAPTANWLAPDAASVPRTAKINIINELINDLANPDPDLRHKAIWELGQRGNSAAVQPLTRLMMDADSHEQSLILAALSEISMQTLKPMNRAIALALQDENPEVRKNAIRDLTRVYDSLGQVGRMLGHATADEDPEVRTTARWALDQLNHVKLTANDSANHLLDYADRGEPLPEDGPSR